MSVTLTVFSLTKRCEQSVISLLQFFTLFWSILKGGAECLAWIMCSNRLTFTSWLLLWDVTGDQSKTGNLKRCYLPELHLNNQNTMSSTWTILYLPTLWALFTFSNSLTAFINWSECTFSNLYRVTLTGYNRCISNRQVHRSVLFCICVPKQVAEHCAIKV